jgi:formamidopyrimidine-DNA glycosylase
VPELPEVEAVRRELEPIMRGARIVEVILRRADLRKPFPPDFARRLSGTTIASVDRRAKYLVLPLSSGETLLMHLGMSGSFRVASSAKLAERKDRHDHVIFRLSSGAIVTFNDPRRFGLMDVIGENEIETHATIRAIGPEPLSDAFDGVALARACARKKIAIKVALLDQRLIAGVGNIYASEALYLARLSPKRRAATIATRSGQPKPEANRLAGAVKQVLREAIARQEKAYRSSRFRVYDREGERCPRRSCAGTIKRITQAGRSTFYCPTCQK